MIFLFTLPCIKQQEYAKFTHTEIKKYIAIHIIFFLKWILKKKWITDVEIVLIENCLM